LIDIGGYIQGEEGGAYKNELLNEPENYIVYVKMYNGLSEISRDDPIQGGEPIRIGFAFVKESNGPCKRTV
jgi:hypothetical protein